MKHRGNNHEVAVMAVCALAQQPRDAYQEAFRSWRQADTALESDAATAQEAPWAAREQGVRGSRQVHGTTEGVS